MRKPNPNLCQEWRQHPVTKFLLEDINETVANIEEEFSSGSFIADTELRTLELNIKAVGQCKALLDIYDRIDNIAEDEE